MVRLPIVGVKVTAGELVTPLDGRLFKGTEGIGDKDGALTDGIAAEGIFRVLGAGVADDGSNVFCGSCDAWLLGETIADGNKTCGLSVPGPVDGDIADGDITCGIKEPGSVDGDWSDGASACGF